jgi:ABC-type Fe3+-hydroxamate transport system substrate-binding protein
MPVRAWSYRGAALALSSSLLACGEAAENERVPASITPPVRAVSLAPVGSELLIALGAGAALVGVDSESGRLADLGALPVVGLEEVAALHPDLVLVPRLGSADAAIADRLRFRGSDVIEVAPHDFDDAFALLRDMGARLAAAARARRVENEIGRELARISGASFGRPRPRIAALLGVAPLELAGGHSFATDLIEIAGGSSVTHGGEERLVRMSAEELVAAGPDLVLVILATELPVDEREAVRAALPDGLRVGFFAFDADRFWVRDAVGTAARLRAVVEPLSLELEGR